MTAPGAGARFWGKYRATVLNNADPERRGRLQLAVPDVLGPTPSTWAEACTPLAGPTGPAMGAYLVPPPGAGVWAEFEQGDVNYPIWAGCRWGGQADIPLAALGGNPADPAIVLQSLMQQMVMISDMPPAKPPPALPPAPTTGGVILRSASGAYVVVSDAGVYISNGKGATISLVGPTVMVNDTALVVT